jgi:hypothetical protein
MRRYQAGGMRIQRCAYVGDGGPFHQPFNKAIFFNRQIMTVEYNHRIKSLKETVKKTRF